MAPTTTTVTTTVTTTGPRTATAAVVAATGAGTARSAASAAWPSCSPSSSWSVVASSPTATACPPSRTGRPPRAPPPADYAGSGSGKVLVEVKDGDNATDIAGTLKTKDVVKSQEAFTDAAKK